MPFPVNSYGDPPQGDVELRLLAGCSRPDRKKQLGPPLGIPSPCSFAKMFGAANLIFSISGRIG